MAKVLIVGCGGIAGRHAGVVKGIDGIELVGVMDVDEERAKGFADKHGAAPYTDLEKALDDAKPSSVVICTPRTVREGPVGVVAERGVPALIEKPPCDKMSTGRRVQEIINKHGLVHSIGFMHRYNPAVDHVRERIEGQTVSLINITIRTPLAMSGLWKTKPAIYSVEKSGGIVGEVGIHYIDLVRLLSGSEVVEVSGLGTAQVLELDDAITTYDTAAWTMGMENGVVANIAQSWASAGWAATVEIMTDKGSACCGLMGGRSRAWGEIDGEKFEFEADNNAEHVALHAAFLKAVETGDMTKVRSPFADALATFEAAAKVNECLYEATAELG